VLFTGDSISLGGDARTLITTLRITPATLATGFAWASAVGLIGALLPALRAARLPVATGLRAT
jgi:putative ABC transport system permease protein